MELLPPHSEPDQPLPPVPAISSEPAYTDAYSYLSQSKFHRVFRCPRTGRRVTYADIGDPYGSPVLYFLPSGCTRWVSLLLENVARAKKVRVLAMDRPGSGGTEMCQLNERVRVTCDMTESLLESLGIEHLALMAASGGVIHLLEYVRVHPERLSPTHPTVLLVSPWAPGNRWLPLIPGPLMLIEHKVIPVVQPALQSVINALLATSHQLSSLASSLSLYIKPAYRCLISPLSRRRKRKPRKLPTSSEPTSPISPISQEKGSTRVEETIVSPVSPTSSDSSSSSSSDASVDRIFLTHPYGQAWDLLEKYLWIENQRGIGQEHLLCLGKGVRGSGASKIGSKAWYAETIGGLRAAPPNSMGEANTKGVAPRIQVYVWWGDEDGMVPRKARAFFDGLMKSSEGVKYRRVELEDAGHGVPPYSMDGMGEALEIVRARCS